jgi:hypothetical protein
MCFISHGLLNDAVNMVENQASKVRLKNESRHSAGETGGNHNKSQEW